MSDLNINLNTGFRNFTWAQNVGEAHAIAAAKHVHDVLVEASKQGRSGVEAALKKLGGEMTSGKFF